MIPCYFCNDLKAWVQIERGDTSRYFCRLVRCSGEVIESQDHKLNYCPECGKKIDYESILEDNGHESSN